MICCQPAVCWEIWVTDGIKLLCSEPASAKLFRLSFEKLLKRPWKQKTIVTQHFQWLRKSFVPGAEFHLNASLTLQKGF